MKRLLFIPMLILVMVSVGCNNKKDKDTPAQHTTEAVQEIYTCPMHPEIIRNKPVSQFAVACDAIPFDLDMDTILRRVESEFPHDGFIVTRSGRYVGMLKKDAVLRLYEVNRKSNEQQILQLQRIESLGTLAG